MRTPKIVTAAEQNLSFQNLFGELGPELHVTGHWTAGHVDQSLSHDLQMCRSYHSEHAAKGWGGIGYHYNVSRAGVIVCLRPVILKGAHVGGWNTSNVGIMFHGGAPGDESKATMTRDQGDAFHWLLNNAHTTKMPRAHRTDRPLTRPSCDRRGHQDWPGHASNACPGSFKREIIHGGNL